MDVETEWRADEDSGDIEAADNAMEFREALTKAIRKLHWSEQERTRAHDAMRQQIPLERTDVSPFRILGLDKEPFVMAENVSHH